MDEEEELPQTAPEKIPVVVRSTLDATKAVHFAYYIEEMVQEISRYINLRRLDGITVAADYDKALAELDRGFETDQSLTRTCTDGVSGVGMTPAVIRDGVIKSHIVLHTEAVLPIQDENDERFKHALYLLAHECAHVAEHHFREEILPGTILQTRITDDGEAVLYQIAEILWSEYAACRASALFGSEQAPHYEECLIGALDGVHAKVMTAMREYCMHGEINRVLEEAGGPLCEPLRFAAYLLGHLDGRDEEWSVVPSARDRVVESEHGPCIERMAEALRELWNTADSWESLTVFDPLKDIARDTLEMGGIILIYQDDGTLYEVDVLAIEATMLGAKGN